MQPISSGCAVVLTTLLLLGCGNREADGTAAPSTDATPPSASSAPTTASALAGTRWRLVEFQSMDDAQGVTRAEDPSLYTLELAADGRVSMRLNCNRGTGSWSAQPVADGSSGTFAFGPLATTRALCPPPSLDARIARDTEYVRSYLLRDGRLYLSLMADAGTYVWAPESDAIAFSTTSDTELEAAILAASPDYRKAIVGDSVGRYVYSRIDLNDDGVDEVFVYLLGSTFCGTGGCNLQLFTKDATGYSLVSTFPTTRTPVIVAERQSSGWSDLWRFRSGGGAPANYIAGRFDGRSYVDGEQISAERAPEGLAVLAGELDFERAIPLTPRD